MKCLEEFILWQKGGKVLDLSVSEQLCTIAGVEFSYNKINYTPTSQTRSSRRVGGDEYEMLRQEHESFL